MDIIIALAYTAFSVALALAVALRGEHKYYKAAAHLTAAGLPGRGHPCGHVSPPHARRDYCPLCGLPPAFLPARARIDSGRLAVLPSAEPGGLSEAP